MNAIDFDLGLEQMIEIGTKQITHKQKTVQILTSRILDDIDLTTAPSQTLADDGTINIHYFDNFPCVRKLALSLRKGVCGFEKRKLNYLSEFQKSEDISVRMDLLGALIKDISELISFFDQKTMYFYESGWITDGKIESMLGYRPHHISKPRHTEIIDLQGKGVSDEDVGSLLFFWKKICTSYIDERQVYESALGDLKNLKANLEV